MRSDRDVARLSPSSTRWPARSQLLGVAVLIVVLAALVGGPAYLSASAVTLLTRFLYFGILAMSLNLLVGWLGLVSFGHAAPFAMGAYGTAIVLRDTDAGIVVAATVGLVVATAGSLIIGVFVTRVSGEIFFALLTLAFAQIVYVLIQQLRWLTGGDDGIVVRLGDTFLATRQARYFTTLLVHLLVLASLWWIQQSAFGRMLRAVREDPVRCEALGLPVTRIRVTSFVASGAIAGVAGILAAFSSGGAFPEFAFWLTSGEALVMILIGGMGHLLGPSVGAAVLIGAQHWAVRLLENWPLYLGLLLVLMVLLFPQGMAQLGSDSVRWIRSKKERWSR